MNRITSRAFNTLQARLRGSFGKHIVPDYHGRSSHKQRDLRTSEPFASVAREVMKAGRTLLYYDRLYTIYQALENCARTQRGGQPLQVAEVGVYQGGTSHFILATARQLGLDVSLHSFDTFEGHPANDLRPQLEPAHNTSMFRETRFEDVKAYLAPFTNVALHQGRVQDTAPALAGRTFAFVHLDVDIYEPTRFGLDFFSQRLSAGGIIVVDDYGFTTCPGAYRAVQEFLATAPDFVGFELLTGQCIITRTQGRTS